MSEKVVKWLYKEVFGDCGEVEKESFYNLLGNFSYIREILKRYVIKEIAEMVGVSVSTTSAVTSLLKKNPSPRNRKLLKTIYELEYFTSKDLSLPGITKQLRVLSILGIIEVVNVRGRTKYYKANKEIISKLWKIENFNENRKIKERYRANELISEILKKIGVSSVEELSLEHIPKIEILRRSDFNRKPSICGLRRAKQKLVNIINSRTQSL